MTETHVPTLATLTKDIKKATQEVEKLVSLLSQGKYKGLEKIVWSLRADLEFLILKFKFVLEKEDGMERWQKNFFANLKGTRSISKAKSILDDVVLTTEQTLGILNKNPKECYKYFWKLKETLSSVMAAFEEKKGYTRVSSDDVFEI